MKNDLSLADFFAPTEAPPSPPAPAAKAARKSASKPLTTVGVQRKITAAYKALRTEPGGRAVRVVFAGCRDRGAVMARGLGGAVLLSFDLRRL